MGNCFVEELNTVINNDSLTRVGEVKFVVSNATKLVQLTLRYNNVVSQDELPTLRCTGDLYFYKPDGTGFYRDIPNCQYIAPRADLNELNFTINGKGLLFIKGTKHTTLLTFGDTAEVDCSSLVYKFQSLSDFTFTTGKLTGDISALSDIDFNVCLLGTYDKSFNIPEIFGGCTSLTNFIPGVNESKNGFGRIEDFVEAQLAAGRTSGTLDTSFKNSQVTLNGSHEPLNVGRVLIVYNGTTVTITVKNTSALLATYSNGTWTYE